MKFHHLNWDNAVGCHADRYAIDVIPNELDFKYTTEAPKQPNKVKEENEKQKENERFSVDKWIVQIVYCKCMYRFPSFGHISLKNKMYWSRIHLSSHSQ